MSKLGLKELMSGLLVMDKIIVGIFITLLDYFSGFNLNDVTKSL